MRTNKRCAFIFTVLLSMIALSACGGSPAQDSTSKTADTTEIVSATSTSASTQERTETEKTTSAGKAETELTDTSEEENSAEEKPDKYIFRCTDENGDPVSGVMIQVCTDEACIIIKSDDSGNAVYEEMPFEYDIHIFRYPEMYELTSEAQFTTAAEYTAYDIKFRSE